MDLEFTPGTGYAAEDKKYNGAVTAALNYVKTVFDSLFTNPVTIKITVNFTGFGAGDPAIAHNTADHDTATYNDIKNAFNSLPTNSIRQQAYQNLPSDPTSGGNFDVGVPEALALGLDVSNATQVWGSTTTNPDVTYGTLSFDSNQTWSFNPVTAAYSGQYAFVGTAEHELTEMMGRGSALAPHDPIDLFRYSAPGQPELKSNNGTSADPTPAAGYFSIDNGTTNWGAGWFNNYANKGGDLTDWATDIVPGDAFGAGNGSAPLSLQDVYMMNVLGWNLSTSVNEVPYGVTDWVGPAQVANAATGSGTVALAQLGNNMIVEAGGTLDVASGGTATKCIIDIDGSMHVQGGTTVGTTVGSAGSTDTGANMYVERGSATDTQIYAGGTEYVSSTDTIADIYAGGVQVVASGGIASGTTIHQGGEQYVSAGGSAIGADVYSGGGERVFAGGTASVTRVYAGGAQEVDGTASGSIIYSGGTLDVASNGTVTSSTIQDGGHMDVGGRVLWWGAKAYDTTVDAGGTETASGFDFGAKVYGSQTIDSGGWASGTAIHGGVQDVASGGTAIGATVDSLGGLQKVEAGGQAQSTKLGLFGFQAVEGTASGTIVSGGAELDVRANGTVSGSIIDNGGYMDVGSRVLWWGAQAYDTTVEAGGTETVSGFDFGAKVYGSQTVDSGGWVSGTAIHGGVQDVSSGGTAIGATVDGLGGRQKVEAGGNAQSTKLGLFGFQVVEGTASGTIGGGGSELDVRANGTVR